MKEVNARDMRNIAIRLLKDHYGIDATKLTKAELTNLASLIYVLLTL